MKEFFKSRKRWIAFFLALLLIVTTCINSSDAFLWATRGGDEAGTESEESGLVEETVEMEVTEEPEEVSEETAEESQETEEAADETSEEEQEVETDAEADADAEEETDAEQEADADQETDAEQDADAEETADEEEVPEEELAVIEEETEYSYAVYYYYDGVEDEDARVEKNDGVLGDSIFTSSADREVVHNGKNYVLDHVENENGKVSENPENNIVRVYYVLAEENAEVYSVMLEHFLSTDNLGTFRSEETVTLTDNDFTNGSVNLIDHAYNRDGMDCLTDAVVLTKDDFDSEHQAFAQIYYEVSSGWMAVLKDGASASNGMRRARAQYVGTLDKVEFVEIGQVPVTIEFLYEDGTTAGSSETVMLEQNENGKYAHEYTVRGIDGYTAKVDKEASSIPAEVTCSLEENILKIDFSETLENGFNVAVIYKAGPGSYTVVRRLLDGGYKTAEEGHYTDETIDTYTDKKVGERTEVEAEEIEGYTAKTVIQQEVKADGSTTVVVEYVKKAYTVKYNTQGGSYIPAKTGYYNEKVEVYSSEAGTPAVPETRTLICTKEEHTHTYTSRRNYWGTTYYYGGCYSQNGATTPNCGKEAHTHSVANGCYEITPAVEAVPATFDPAPIRQGYTFTGWYKDAACTEEADKAEVMTGNIEVFAGWEASEATYTVAYFKEVWDNSTNSSYYAFVKSEQKTAVVGTKVNGSAYTTTFIDSSYYAKNTTEAAKNVEVKADGTTVVEVKYDLKRYTFVFDLNKNAARIKMDGETYDGNNYKIENVVLGQDIASKWPTQAEITGADNFYAWQAGNSTPFATKRFEVTKDMLPSSGTNITYTAIWGNYSTKTVEYWLQSADDDAKYEKSELYSQTFKTNSGINQKDIYGFTKLTRTPAGYSGSSGNTYRFYYDRNTSTLTYMQTDGSTIEAKKVKYGANINTSTYRFTPNRPDGMDSDYTFKGWYDNNQGVGEPYNFTTMPDGGLGLYAIWEAPEVTVTIHNTENDTTITVKKNDLAEIPVPEKEGYEFDGWYTSGNFADGTEFDVNAPLTHDVDIYAKWVEDTDTQYTILHVIEAEGKESKYQTVIRDGIIGEKISARALSIKIDSQVYVVKGTSEQSITLKRASDQNVIKFVYVPIESMTYTVKYQYNGTTKKEEDPKTVQAPSWSVYPNYEIKKELSDDGYSINEKFVKAEAPYDVIFTLTPIEYTISYVGVDETGNKLSFEINEGEAALYPTTYTVVDSDHKLGQPSIEGYEFVGWTTDGTVDGVSGSKVDPDKDVVIATGSKGHLKFTAHFQKRTAKYTVEYYWQDTEGDGYTLHETIDKDQSGKELSGEIGATVNAEIKEYTGFDHVEREGYSVESGEIQENDGLVLNVYYNRETYNIVYKITGDWFANENYHTEENVRYGADISLIADDMEKAGYVWHAWEGFPADGIMPNGDVEVTGYYEASENTGYTVKHFYENLDGEYEEAKNEQQSMTGTTGQRTNAAAKTVTGFTAQAFEQLEIAADGSTVVNIYYNRNVHTVTYQITGSYFTEPEYKVESYKYGAALELIDDNMDQPGYKWSGWTELPVVMGDNDVVVTGSYSKLTDIGYTVEYYLQNIDDDGYTLDDVLELNGEFDTVVSAPDKKYEGFEKTTTDDSIESGKILADGSLVLKVYYNRNTYSLTYKITGELFANESYKVQSNIKFGKKLSLITDDMSKAGYEWSGWNNLPDTMPAHDVVVSGYYTASTDTKYTVKHLYQNIPDDQYTENEDEQEEKTGTTGTLTEASAKSVTGFTAQEVTQQTIGADGMTEVVIHYDRNKHTVTYKIEGDYFAAEAYEVQQNVKYGAELSLIEDDMSKEGYVWSGWSELPKTMPDEDVEVKGSYSKRNDLAYAVITYYKDADGNIVEGLTETVENNEAVYDEEIPYTLAVSKEKGENSYVFENAELREGSVGEEALVKSLGELTMVNGAPQLPEKETVNVAVNRRVIVIYYALDNKGPNTGSDNIPDYKEYTVTYIGNGGINKMGETSYKDSHIYPVDADVYVWENMFTRENAKFAGWKDQNGTFYELESLTEDTTVKMVEGGVTLTAQWKKLEVNKNFEMPKEDENGKQTYKLNETIHFTIKVKNTGDVALTNVVVTDDLPGAVIDAGDGYTVNEEKTMATIGGLAVGAEVTVNASYVVTEDEIGTKFKNSATAKVENGPEVTDETTEIPVDELDKSLLVTKSITNPDEASGTDENGEPTGLFTVGDTVKFEIVVKNNGNQTLENIEVTDKLEDAEIIAQSAFNRFFNFVTGNGYRVEDNIAKIDSLKPGEDVTIEAEYEIKESDLGKSFKNVAVAAGGDTEGEGKTEDPIPVEDKNPEFTVVKTVDTVDGAEKTEYAAGESINYTITVTNTGNMTLENVVVTDMLKNAAGAVTFEEQEGVTINGNIATIESLPIEGSVELKCSYVVQREDAGNAISNAVTVNGSTSEEGDPDPEPKEDETDDVQVLYRVTVYYQYSDGTTAAPTVDRYVKPGDVYRIDSPVIEGYNSSAAFVAGTMPERNLEFVVYYTTPATPGGGGGGTTPDTPEPPTPPTEPTIPVVPIIPGPVPAGVIPVVVADDPALAEVDDEAVPMGALIDVDDDGNVTITPIGEEEVPLAGGTVDEHACCILHFLLMLAALIIYTCYTNSMKKRQKKLAELKDQLAEETLKRQLGITDNKAEM